MKTMRFDYKKVAPGSWTAMDGVETYLEQCGLDKRLIMLVHLRASQINGCAFCLDYHWKDLVRAGDTEVRLYSLPAWRECPYYSDRERAALEWTEAVTRVAEGHVPDATYAAVREHFSETELADLTLAIAAINAWNRL